ncbi:hypothetical protein NDU88_006600 [Pleurodeles waltl]|uniref:Uncharacterized protein n=1 Tax=Pleurodeles waltl TaxID=8319 RepID=A0AAV7SQ00_PLEWA|nr:hypothetical protein NDU88_006600 [Pleurodeles waltl]
MGYLRVRRLCPTLPPPGDAASRDPGTRRSAPHSGREASSRKWDLPREEGSSWGQESPSPETSGGGLCRERKNWGWHHVLPGDPSPQIPNRPASPVGNLPAEPGRRSRSSERSANPGSDPSCRARNEYSRSSQGRVADPGKRAPDRRDPTSGVGAGA